jgi:glycosyltransferase involved in cell wall biosynthesis
LVDRVLTGKRFLEWAGRRGASTDARDLGDLTLSVLQGESGKQAKELDRLVTWFRDDFRPELVHFSNSMLLGMAGRIRRELGVSVVCSLQGEDLFLDQLREPHRTRVVAELRRRAQDADGFIAQSRYYATHMASYLEVPPERIHHVPLGINLAGHGPAASDRAASPFVVGYLARVCPEKGLHLLVEGFRRLAGTEGRDAVRLRIAGYLGGRDQPYFEEVMEQVAEWGLSDAVEHVGEVDRAAKIEFLRSIDVLSVPTVYHEPKGIFALEAMANGVPVVQPGHGAFPEMIEATGGGILVEPDSADALADGLRALRKDPDRRRALGQAGHRAVHERFGVEQAAHGTLNVYRRCVEGAAGM